MSCKTEQVEIQGVTYSVTQWSATKAAVNKFKLIKYLGSSTKHLTPLMDVVNKEGLDADLTKLVTPFIDFLGSVFEKHDPEDVFNLIKSFIIGVGRDGDKITETSFNIHFEADDLTVIYKLFLLVIKVNYKNLMKGQHA